MLGAGLQHLRGKIPSPTTGVMHADIEVVLSDEPSLADDLQAALVNRGMWIDALSDPDVDVRIQAAAAAERVAERAWMTTWE